MVWVLAKDRRESNSQREGEAGMKREESMNSPVP